IDELKQVPAPKFDDPNEPYTVLAKLPLPIYITTNYDDFMEQSLTKQNRDVKKDLCKWVKSIDETSPLAENGFKPHVANPVVFHVYGYATNQQSLSLTEDDYFQLLINLSMTQELIPSIIQKAFTANSVMLLGYSLDDWDFRILFHFLARYLNSYPAKPHVPFQTPPSTPSQPINN